MASLPSKKKSEVYLLGELPLRQNMLIVTEYLFTTYFSLSSQYTQYNYPMNSITGDLTDFNGVAF
jgi:hypothetical protein